MKYLGATAGLFLLSTVGSGDPDSACGSGEGNEACASYAQASLGVTVRHAETDAHICDATVTATDGDFSELLEETAEAPGSKRRSYFGPTERPGTYRVEASRDGFVTAAEEDVEVVLDEDGCHVVPVSLTLELEPR